MYSSKDCMVLEGHEITHVYGSLNFEHIRVLDLFKKRGI